EIGLALMVLVVAQGERDQIDDGDLLRCRGARPEDRKARQSERQGARRELGPRFHEGASVQVAADRWACWVGRQNERRVLDRAHRLRASRGSPRNSCHPGLISTEEALSSYPPAGGSG